MSEITLFVPREEMLHQAHNILQAGDYNVKEIKLISTTDSVSEARSALGKGTNIIIARGYQASLIKHYTNIPVVEITLTGQEMGLLITKAKKIVNKERPVIGVVGFNNMFCDMTYFNQIYNIELRTYLVPNADELNLAIKQSIQDNLDIIIGGDTAILAASDAGIPSLFLSSTEDSIREAFKVASKMEYAIDIEKRGMAQLETLLDYSFSGIVKMNQQGNIMVINRIMEEIINKSSAEVVGRLVTEVFKEIPTENITKILEEGNEIFSSFLTVNDTALVVIIAPIKVDNRIDGAILTCHKVKKMKQLETEILRERYLFGYIAKGNFEDIPHSSKEMQKSIALAKVYAQSKSPVLICGEIGTEMDLFAQGIHNNSLSKNGPYITVNCFGINDEMQTEVLFGNSKTENDTEKGQGALVAANHGTVLISEIDKLSMNSQYRLYKIIRYKSLIRNDIEKTMSIDVRIITTTTKKLSILVQQGLFREDLYYLLSGLTIDVEPLRKRSEDLEKLLETYIKLYCDMYSRYHVLTAGAKRILLDYPWYGNLIQLESFCDRMILSASHRTLDEVFIMELLNELYPIIQQQNNRERIVVYKDPEALVITEVLEKHGGNRTLAASELGISKTTLWRHMKKYGISNKYES
ncbi:MAG: sigma 54-interacting transcriptional regulator [Mobilitalea sp.]